MGSTVATYKRGQVEWALWRAFTFFRGMPPDPPKVFLTRIKRLLETDRGDKIPAGVDFKPPARYAFSSQKSGGQGVDAPFTAFDAFCLAVALDLLDTGFKPSEIVFLLRYLRPQFEDAFENIVDEPPPPLRMRQTAASRPNLPSYEYQGKQFADGRLFWVVEKIELTEVYEPPRKRTKKAETPIFLNPTFCRGIRELTEELGQMNHERIGFGKALVLEIAYLADSVSTFLAQAPVMKRGRH